jgi:hypothetical protein
VLGRLRPQGWSPCGHLTRGFPQVDRQRHDRLLERLDDAALLDAHVLQAVKQASNGWSGNGGRGLKRKKEKGGGRVAPPATETPAAEKTAGSAARAWLRHYCKTLLQDIIVPVMIATLLRRRG